MYFTITTKSQLKNVVAKNNSNLALAFDYICKQDGLKNDSRIVILPSEEWKEPGVHTRCTDLIYSGKRDDLHMMYVFTCHLKNMKLSNYQCTPSEYRFEPSQALIFDLIPVYRRDEGAIDPIYIVMEYPNFTGKVNQAFGPDELCELTHKYGEEIQEHIQEFIEDYKAIR